MADPLNYTNSPLSNPDFLNRVILAGQSQAPEPVILNSGILARAVAAEPESRVLTPEERKSELEAEQDNLENRSAGQIIGDSLLSMGATVPDFLGSLTALGVSTSGSVIQNLSEDDSVAHDVGNTTSQLAVDIAGLTDRAVAGIRSLRSDVGQESDRIQSEIRAIDDEMSQEQYELDVAAGDSEFFAGLVKFGRDSLNSGERILNSPVAAGDLISNAVGSIATGSILARTGQRIATGAAQQLGIEGRRRLAMEAVGSSVGMGVTEAASIYSSTVNEVMARSPEEMAGSAMYQELIDSGMGHEEALVNVADAAGLYAFRRQLPSATAIGLISARFNAHPLSVMQGSNPLGAFIAVGKETLEEGGQGGTGQLSQNMAIQEIVDPNQSLMEGVADSTVSSMIGGFGSSSIMSAVPSGGSGGERREPEERETDEEAIERLVKVVEQISTQREADTRVAVENIVVDSDLDNSVVETVNENIIETVTETVSENIPRNRNIITDAVDFVRSGEARQTVQPVVDMATNVINTVKTAATEFLNRPDPVVQDTTIKAAVEASNLAQIRVTEATPDAPASESLVIFTSPVSDAPTSVIKEFGETITSETSLADTMSGVVSALKGGTVKVSSMSDESVLFVTENFNKIQSLIPGLPEDIRTPVQRMLASPDLKRIRQRASRIDLNTVANNITDRVSETIKNLTLSIARVNPMNVNPVVVGKILEQDDREDLTPEKIKTLQVAQKASIAMNEHIADSVEIEEDKYFKLIAAGNKIPKPETASERTSRDLIIGDLSGDNKVPSVNEFLRQIVQGINDPAGMTTSEKGVATPVASAISRLRMLIKHMQNKVEALNESFDRSDEKGKGPTVNFTSMVNGNELRQKGQAGSATVYYHKSSENSVALARRVGADAQVVVKVWNALAEAYPDQFPEGSLELPTVKTESKSEAVAEEKPKETKSPEIMNISFESGENAWLSNLADRPFTFRGERFFSVEHAYQSWKSGEFDQKTYDKYKGPGIKIQGKATKTEGGWNLRLMKALMLASFQQNPAIASRLVATGDAIFTSTQDKGVMGKEFPRILTEVRAALVAQGVKPTTADEGLPGTGRREARADAVDEKIISYMNKRKVFGNKIRHIKGRKPTEQELKKVHNRLEAMSSFVGMDVSTLLARIYVFDVQEDGFEFGGFALESNIETFGVEGSIIAINAKLFDFSKLEELNHIVAHEMGHVIDYTYSALLGFTGETANFIPEFWAEGTNHYPNDGISREDPVKMTQDGSIYAEVKASIKRSNWFKKFFDYALGYDESIDVSSELFAELVAMHTVYGDEMAKDFPKFLAHYNKVITAIGGKIEINEETTTTEGGPNTKTPEGSVSKSWFERVGKIFKKTFKLKTKVVEYNDPETMLNVMDKVEGSDTYTQFAREQIRKVIDAMNERVSSLRILANKTETPAEALKTRTDEILEFREMKALAIVDPVTGKYDETLLGLAVLAVVDWMTTARAMGSRGLDDLLEDMDLQRSDLTEDQIVSLMKSVPTRTTSEKLARKVIKLWNVEVLSEAEMVNYRGITEGVIKEIMTVMSEQENSWIDLVKVDTGKAYDSAGYGISSLKTLQDQIGIKAHGLLDKTFFPEDQVMASFGEPPKNVAKTVDGSDVILPRMVRNAMRTVQNTAHLRAEPVIEFFNVLGQDAFATMSGRRNKEDLPKNHPYRSTIEGKNRGIDRDWETAFTLANGAKNEDGSTVGVFYRVAITVVGRMQMMGVNPQNNKLLRALVTPTHAKLDMVNNQSHKDGFWLTVAQSSGLAKVEKINHANILKTVREDFMKTWGKATSVALDYLKTGNLDQDAFVFEMVTATEGEPVSVAQMNAVLAVARLIKAKLDGTLSEFETSLSFELDGKTDGPANMMVALGQGMMTRMEYENFFRVGYFLGQPSGTLNQWFSEDGTDLYEEGSANSMRKLISAVNQAKPYYAKRIMALQRFAAHFGDFKIVDGDVVMTRATSKNPMTKKVYGAGPDGIGRGIADEVLQGMYAQLVDMPIGVTFTQYLNYPEFLEDFNLVFGVDIDPKADPLKVIIKGETKLNFDTFVTNVIGRLLSASTEEIISIKTKGVTDLLVQATNVQGSFMQKLFSKLLYMRATELVKEGKMRSNKKGEPNLRQFPKGDYEAIIKQVMGFAPYYADGLQNIRVGEFEGELSEIEISSNLTGNIRSKSTMEMFGDMGVKVIPYLIQARGDAMMINRVFSAEDAPQRAIPIFDGIDLSITDFMEASIQINRSVLENWNHDVMSPVVEDFTSFIAKVEHAGFTELLDEVYKDLASDEASTPLGVNINSTNLISELQEVALLNQARKNVFKRISKSVDHMGGAARPYSVGTETFTYEEINEMIQKEELRLKSGQEVPAEVTPKEITPEEVKSTLVVTDSGTIFDALAKSTSRAAIRQTMRALKDLISRDTRIIMGTSEEIQEWIQDNLNNNDEGPTLEHMKKGFYDVDNNIIFITSNNVETITHELIHMATFKAVLDHYQGDQSNEAVKNLEILMDQFLKMDFSQSSKKLKDAAYSAMAQILKYRAKDDAFSKAAALNEFMAWTLTNTSLIVELKKTTSSVIMNLTKRALAWIQRVLRQGTIPTDMYSNILFNTAMISQGPDSQEIGIGGNKIPPGGNNISGNVTPQASNFTNFWIDLLRQRLEESKTYQPYRTQARLLKYIATADRVISELAMGGIYMDAYQKETFTAIHAVIAAELTLDSRGLLALGKIYEHITNSLTPEMFGQGPDAQLKYSTIMNAFGDTKNDEGISDAIAVLLGLSQTSNAFRNALDLIPRPQTTQGVKTSSLNDVLSTSTAMLMQKMIYSTDTEGKGVKEILDTLSDRIIQNDRQSEFEALKYLMSSFDAADKFTGGLLSQLAGIAKKTNEDLQRSNVPGIAKVIFGSVALATQFIDKDSSEIAAKGVKAATHMDGILDGAVFIREFIAEIVGSDKINSKTIQLLDRVNYEVQSTRQGFREELPVILQNEFDTSPDAKEWKSMHHVFGKLDFGVLFSIKDPDQAFEYLNDESVLDAEIVRMERQITSAFGKVIGSEILNKSHQLADYMNDQGAGFQLWRNAYAIHKLSGAKKPNLIPVIDRLISLYALKRCDINLKEQVARLQASDPKGVHSLLVYIQALNKEEDSKTITPVARMNGYKGYIPNLSAEGRSIKIASDDEVEILESRGYVRIGDYTGYPIAPTSMGYYVSGTRQVGNYSQGVLQQVQDTYRGVNAINGVTVSGVVSGLITSPADIITINDYQNQMGSVPNPKETLMPIFDDDGGVIKYELALNPDLMETHLEPESNAALMVGVWAGRQVEEKLSKAYNDELIVQLKNIWDNREPGTDGLFIKMNDPILKDKVYKESWKVIPPNVKDEIRAVFGDEGFMVRKDMVNLSLGYRDPSIVDVWNGTHRLPESVSLAIQVASKVTMGKEGLKRLSAVENATMATISTAKDLIVIRSLVVPFMNTQSNVFQLVNRGVGTKDVARGYTEKFGEIDRLNENLKKLHGLRIQEQLNQNDPNRLLIIKQQKQVIDDENKRMGVWPLVEAGAYKSISEGMTELDAHITEGRFGEWIETQLQRLPTGVQTVVKYGLLSKDTAIYKGANKAVQYGDFIAKSIYYDDLVKKGMKPEDAIPKVNEEFVNFSLLPGRQRQYLESMGATWFLTFKIRSMKVALQTLRENPIRSLTSVGILGLESGPVTDNFLAKMADGTLNYSLGWDMLWDAPSINPWYTLSEG